MTEAEWLASDDPSRMLRWATCAGPSGSGEADLERWRRRPSDRKLRLFACACALAVWPLLSDPRSRRAVEVAERYADGGATGEELKAAKHAACAVANSLSGLARGAADEAQQCCSNSAFYAAEYWHRDPVSVSLPVQAALLRDVVGSSWRPVETGWYRTVTHPDGTYTQNVPTANPAWLTPAVLGIARRAYDGRDFAALPVLADALEEARCEEETLLRHLRGWERDPRCAAFPPGGMRHPCWVLLRGPHVRGCWAVDLILGRS